MKQRRFFKTSVLILMALAISPFCLSKDEVKTSDLITVYLKGRITLTPDPDFAAGTDWESLFLDRHRSIKVAPDGSIFVSNSRDHNIYKFNADGKLITKFGKRGQGPGDLEFPGELSILDGKYLVVGEYMSRRRISLFRLDGTFHTILKTQYPPRSTLALGNWKIAYIGLSSRMEQKGDSFEMINLNRIIIIDAATGNERELETITTTINEIKDGTVMIARSAEGDLLVGLSIWPEIEVYDPEGKKKGILRLTIDRIPVTKKITETYQIKQVITRGGKRTTINYPLGEFLPYFCSLTVDSAGNILVFKMSEDPTTGPIIIQVYSKAGKFLCETELYRGGFDLTANLRPFRRIHTKLDFTERGIFGILPLKGDELETPHLFCVSFQP
jgi:hypothetical protein